MKDRILAAYLDDFVATFGLGDLDPSEAFEYFANYCVLARHYPETFDPEQVSVGGAGDLGLDGIAILVNEHLVATTSDVDHFKSVLRRLEAHFIFIQAKTSPHFEAADIGTFLAGTRQFFAETLPSTANEAVSGMHAVKEHIFRHSIDMETVPRCTLYYVAPGEWIPDDNLLARRDLGLSTLKATALFSEVEFVPVGADYLKRVYRELHHGIVRDIQFDKHTILPEIAGVSEAYIGIVPATEYLKLICDDTGALNRRLFYDNVRDFQGLTSVNQEIAATLQDGARNDRFSLLNNGVTIVARGATKIGARFNLKNYQIVNGCQTSHMLYLNRDHLTPTVHIPVKLIVTEDNEVTTQIIQGTNRQTEVKLEAFESVKPFQKRLEEFYQAASRSLPSLLYYERRSKQYENLDVRRDSIISLAVQIKCFIAMFLNEPQSTPRYYGELLSSYRGKIFSESHNPIAYFTAGASLLALEQLFAHNQLPRTWRVLKYPILMVFRLQNEPFALPYLNSNQIDRYCQGLLDHLRDEQPRLVAFRKAGELADSIRATLPRGREAIERTRAYTTALLEVVANHTKQPASASRLRGTVAWFSDIKGFGVIAAEGGDEYFVHYSNIVGRGYRSLLAGAVVTFSIAQGPKRLQAVEVSQSSAG